MARPRLSPPPLPKVPKVKDKHRLTFLDPVTGTAVPCGSDGQASWPPHPSPTLPAAPHQHQPCHYTHLQNYPHRTHAPANTSTTGLCAQAAEHVPAAARQQDPRRADRAQAGEP
eukprot:scaffold97545_cov56-Phaeocystis_antarctica.AAC.2